VAFTPIFIVGVPRSGTTLLRVLLDSHSQIAALPETPWLLGAYGPDPSLRGVLNGLIEGPYGTVRNVADVEPDHVFEAGRALLETMFAPLLQARNKSRLAFKTPADIRHLDFLLKLAPDAFYIHITRDGRDVAASQLAKRGTFFNDLKEYRRVGFANLLQRWAEWERRIRSLLYHDGVRVVHVKYEDLIADPSRELRRISDFLALPFEAAMLDYGAARHDYPAWEAGSSDVSRNERIEGSSAGKWRGAKMTAERRYALTKYDHVLVEFGYSTSGLAPHPARQAWAALYPLASPFLELGARAKLALRPMFKNRARMAAFGGLILLALQFLLPQSWLGAYDLVTDRYQPLLCFAVALGFTGAFGPILLRRADGAHPLIETFLKSAIGLGGYVALLEATQNLVPGRHAGMGDFLLNMGAVILAMLVVIPVLVKKAGPAQDRPTLALAAQRA
jgi:protein-tyrosine sulfotransferase